MNDFYTEIAEISGLDRGVVKTTALNLLYQGDDISLANSLKITISEARTTLLQYHKALITYSDANEDI